MLLPIQAGRGRGFTLVLMHGQMGIVPYDRGRVMARYFGPDQPIVGLESRGFQDATEPASTVEQASREYLAELAQAGAAPPYVFVAMCEGYTFALEMAHQLWTSGQPAPLVLLIDPPGYPPGGVPEEGITEAVKSHYHEHARAWLKAAIERTGELPFDTGDPRQLDRAASTAMKVLLSICRHRTQPYFGRVDVIATGDRATQIGREDWPWRQRILKGVWTLVKLDCSHGDLFASHAGAVFTWMRGRMSALGSPRV